MCAQTYLEYYLVIHNYISNINALYLFLKAIPIFRVSVNSYILKVLVLLKYCMLAILELVCAIVFPLLFWTIVPHLTWEYIYTLPEFHPVTHSILYLYMCHINFIVFNPYTPILLFPSDFIRGIVYGCLESYYCWHPTLWCISNRIKLVENVQMQ